MISPSSRNARALTLVRDDAARLRRAGLWTLAALVVMTLMLSGCNTTAGVGQDVRATGNAVTRGANDVKSKM